MPKFRVLSNVTMTLETIVDASDKQQAMSIANDRAISSLKDYTHIELVQDIAESFVITVESIENAVMLDAHEAIELGTQE